MLWLSVGESGESAKPPPVGCARIGPETLSESLSGKCSECFGKDVRVFQPCLKVTGTGLDDGARLASIGGQRADFILVEVVQQGEAALS